MKKTALQKLLCVAALFLIIFPGFSQIPGFINRTATNAAGRLVLDPNSDGYTSTTTAGFGNNDIVNSEIPYKAIRSYSIEPNSDLRRGPNNSFSDFVPDSAGNGFYFYFTPAQQLLFRFRLGGIMPGSKGYSIQMDTDGKFGASGPNADPNYLPSTTGTNGNPGFEIEIVLETNFRIAIYNVDGSSSAVLVKQYTNWQDMSQVSIASSNDNGDPDFFMDFYIPFSDLQAAPFNLTTSSSIRLTATTVMSPGPATGGPRSDIYGTATDSYDDFIDGQPACNIFTTPVTCPTAMCTAAPSVNFPLNTGVINISGSWTKSVLPGSTSSATITVYKNGIAAGTVVNVSTGSSWTLNNISLINGDVITAKAQASGESMCLTSNAVAASTCNASTIPATPVLLCSSGSKGIGGTNLSNGWTVHIDNLTRNTFNDNVSNANGLFGANTGTSPNINWLYSGGCSTGSPLTSGSYKVYYTNDVTGCSSLPAYFCAAGNGGTALAGTLTAPVISSPANLVFTTATTVISGTTDANAVLKLYINGINTQTVTASVAGVFNFTNLTLLNGQQLYIVAELNTGLVSTSKCAAQTSIYTVSCYTSTPLISGDNNNQLTAGAPIQGTSSEPAGTLIRVYTSLNVLVATTEVQANGSWSTGNAGTTPAVYNALAATSYYANAQNATCGISGNSAGYSAQTSTSSGRCGIISGPVGPGAASILGILNGSFSTTTVNLYLDGQLIGSSVTSGTTWGPIAVNTTAVNTLYSNGVLSIGIQESGKQEVACPTSAISISCSPLPVAPLFSPASITINQFQSVTYTILNAVAGSFYALTDSSSGQSLGQGKWAVSNGTLTLTTNNFNTIGIFKVIIKSTVLSGVTLCTAVSSTGIVTVNPFVLPLTLVQFKAKKSSGAVLLEWSTSLESNLNRFEIEKSADGLAFEKTGQVLAAGFSSSQKNYSFTDPNPYNALTYYRLKMIDNDGKFTYSNTLVIEGNKASIVLDAVMPNPFTDAFGIKISSDRSQALIVQLSDLAGRIVYTKEVQAKSGANTILCNGLSGLAEGVYILRIKTTDGILQWKLMKTN